MRLHIQIAMLGCGLGEALEPALQGLVTYLTDSAENAQLFTTVALCDTLAELTGGPFTARLLAIGRRDGHPSDGICFLASSVRIRLSQWYTHQLMILDYIYSITNMGSVRKSGTCSPLNSFGNEECCFCTRVRWLLLLGRSCGDKQYVN